MDTTEEVKDQESVIPEEEVKEQEPVMPEEQVKEQEPEPMQQEEQEKEKEKEPTQPKQEEEAETDDKEKEKEEVKNDNEESKDDNEDEAADPMQPEEQAEVDAKDVEVVKEKEEEAKASPENGDNVEEESKEEASDKQASKESGAALPPRPIKRARTAYFIFCNDRRPAVQAQHVGEPISAVAKVLGQEWGALPIEEKERYQLMAAKERERVSKEMEDYKMAGGVIEEATKDQSALVFPLTRIRNIAKLDAEVKGMSKEAILLITKCAELQLAKLGQESVTVARLQNRRKLLPEDVAQVCASREQFMFLKDDVKDLLREQKEDNYNTAATSGKPKASDVAKESAAEGAKPLTSYFAKAGK